MNEFMIFSNHEYLKRNVKGYYHTYYRGYKKTGNPDYLNYLKNTFGNESIEKLKNARQQLFDVLSEDLSSFDKKLTICVVPRSKAENTYSENQLLFKKLIQVLIKNLNFRDGSDYLMRHTDTKTTHLAHSPRGEQYAGDGDMPYPGITNSTCNISNDAKGKDILLIDDIYTVGVNINEDAIQALFDHGAKSIVFYAVGKTV